LLFELQVYEVLDDVLKAICGLVFAYHRPQSDAVQTPCCQLLLISDVILVRMI